MHAERERNTWPKGKLRVPSGVTHRYRGANHETRELNSYSEAVHNSMCLLQDSTGVFPVLQAEVRNSKANRRDFVEPMCAKWYEVKQLSVRGGRKMGDQTSSNKQEQGSRVQSRERRAISTRLYPHRLFKSTPGSDAAAVLNTGARERAEVETGSCGRLNTTHHHLLGEQWDPCNGSEGDRSCLSIISWSLRRHVVVFRRDQAASSMKA